MALKRCLCCESQNFNWEKIDKWDGCPLPHIPVQVKINRIINKAYAPNLIEPLNITTFQLLHSKHLSTVKFIHFFHVEKSNPAINNKGRRQSSLPSDPRPKHFKPKDISKSGKTLKQVATCMDGFKMLAEKLHDPFEFDQCARRLNAVHLNLPEMKQSYLKDMCECVDVGLKRRLRRRDYQCKNRDAMISFLSLVYFKLSRGFTLKRLAGPSLSIMLSNRRLEGKDTPSSKPNAQLKEEAQGKWETDLDDDVPSWDDYSNKGSSSSINEESTYSLKRLRHSESTISFRKPDILRGGKYAIDAYDKYLAQRKAANSSDRRSSIAVQRARSGSESDDDDDSS